MNENDLRDATQTFESRLMILRKDKDGWVVGFKVHPNDAPGPLLDAPLGTRFQVTLFEIGDNEEPVVPRSVLEGKRHVAISGELCRHPDFQKFILGKEFYDLAGEKRMEEFASEKLRDALGIESRTEIATNKKAQENFLELLKKYRDQEFPDDNIPF